MTPEKQGQADRTLNGLFQAPFITTSRDGTGFEARLNNRGHQCSVAVQRRDLREGTMMSRMLTVLIAGLIAVGPVGVDVASAQSRRGDNPLVSQFRQDRAREEAREGQRISARDVVRRVSAGREGRMLNVSERGGGTTLTYVVRWEYPGGRISDITVDGRTGRILGER